VSALTECDRYAGRELEPETRPPRFRAKANPHHTPDRKTAKAVSTVAVPG
jgi:hypothetical protein